jgi:hypothetical protein
VHLDFIFLIFFTLEGGVYKLMFLFFPPFDMWKEEGKGVSFFLKTIF